MPSEAANACGVCGLAGVHGGPCPRCVLRAAIARPAHRDPLPRPWGRYILRDLCGTGGMGVVYEAEDTLTGRTVALKMLREGELADDDALRRLMAEARRASSLRHEHIVRILDVGEHEGTSFFTMDFVDGPSLADLAESYRGRPRRAARLVETLADAVHHAHQRLVIHRDLKPANVIMEGDAPRLVDFGVATRVGADDAEAAGTLPYMAPEQLDPTAEQTIAVDVYGLGAILYELLCGRPPFDAATPDALVEKVRMGSPVPPRATDPHIDADLEQICLKCLARDPTARYQSAAGLARDLERFRRGEPVLARPLGRVQRAARWIVRHPAPSTLALTSLLLLCGVSAAAVSVAHEQEAELRAEVLQANAFAARALSGSFLLELRTLADALERLAADPRVVAALDPGDEPARARLRERVAHEAFDTFFLLDADGIGVLRVPEAEEDLVGVSSRWRDYFAGAARLGAAGQQGVHVSRAYRSQASGTARVSLSAPVFDASGRWRGVLQASVETAGVFGRLEARTAGGAARIVTLAGRADREDEAASLEDHWLIVLHRDVERGSVHRVRSPALAALRPSPERQLVPPERQLVPPDPADLVDGDYVDPVPDFAGRWLAGVAPVGGTELAVIVQTHEQDAVAVNRRLGERLLVTAGLAGLIGMMVLLTVAVAVRRRDRAARR